jgi:hypothetical protein
MIMPNVPLLSLFITFSNVCHTKAVPGARCAPGIWQKSLQNLGHF